MGISTPGVGSGLDVSGIVSKLMAIEQQPLSRLQTQEAKLTTRISAFGRIQGTLSSLQDAANALKSPTLWSSSTATSSDAATAGVTATGSASPGNYGVSVLALAQPQSVAGSAFASASVTPGAGTLTIDVSDIQVTDSGLPTETRTFNGSPARKTTSIDVASTDTLAQVRDKINAAGTGVTASIVNDGGKVRLVMRSAETGLINGFRVSVADGGSGPESLSTLTYDPTTGSSNGMQVSQHAQDASFTVDGLKLASSSNQVTGALDGITIDLKKTGGPINVAVATDKAAMKSAIQRFVDAYNGFNSTIAAQTKYDATTKTAGTLQGDSVAVGIQSRMRQVLGQSMAGVASGGYARLSELGIAVQKDGSLQVDSAKLDKALADPAKVRSLFAATDADVSRQGFAQRFASLAAEILGSSGAITTATDSLNRRVKSLDSQQETLQRRLESTQARLVKQYNALDQQLASLSKIDFSKLPSASSDD